MANCLTPCLYQITVVASGPISQAVVPNEKVTFTYTTCGSGFQCMPISTLLWPVQVTHFSENVLIVNMLQVHVTCDSQGYNYNPILLEMSVTYYQSFSITSCAENLLICSSISCWVLCCLFNCSCKVSTHPLLMVRFLQYRDNCNTFS